MIGSTGRTGYNPAGRMGPRDCDPLGTAWPSRIARAQPQWLLPKCKSFALTTTPQKIATLNPNRGWISFAAQITANATDFLSVLLALSSDCLTGSPPCCVLGWTAVTTGTPGDVPVQVFTTQLSYLQHGGLVTAEWWGRMDSTNGSANLCVSQQDYMG